MELCLAIRLSAEFLAFLIHSITSSTPQKVKMASSVSSSLLLLFALFAAVATASHKHDGYLHLRFYNHERILGSGPNATVVYAVERTVSNTGAGFGNVIVYDNLLRSGVEQDSPIIGRNQGMGVGSSLAENSGLTNFQLVFTAGKYSGSSLALQGLFPVAPLGTVFERAITGGTGKFRLARGYLLTTEVRSTNTTLTGQLDAYITFR